MDFEVDEEFNMHIQIKDLFNGGDGDDYLNPRVISMNSDVDLYLIIELLGYGENNNVEYVLGEKKYTIFSLIRRQILNEKELAK